MAFPYDIVVRVVGFLPVLDIIGVRTVSRQYLDATKERSVWMNAFWRAEIPLPPNFQLETIPPDVMEKLLVSAARTDQVLTSTITYATEPYHKYHTQNHSINSQVKKIVGTDPTILDRVSGDIGPQQDWNVPNDSGEGCMPETRQEHTPPKPPPKTTTTNSPPLPMQNRKTVPVPPKVIVDMHHRFQFNGVGFLGEGGFARVFEVTDPRGTHLACKIITKNLLKRKEAKRKLWDEIKIHRSLEHPNIIHFHNCFEDGDNVYMTLELCPSGSLMDILLLRRRFTEPEARFFMVQLIGACNYMHTHKVIHRDLKLGNLLLDANMNIKVADFGFAVLIENPGERKKTLCGTPNYMAPEVLFNTANGHSFEVDIWSIGVILYTLIVGRPPFETKYVKNIYNRIRNNHYEFPVGRKVSGAAKTLVKQILKPNPSERPTLYEMLDNIFFTQGPVPAYIPASAHDVAPDFSNITQFVSDSNLRRLRHYALLDQGVNMPSSTSENLPSSNKASKSIQIN